VRKLIQTLLANECLELRKKVLKHQDSGHSVFIAKNHYDIRSTSQNVHSARDLHPLTERGNCSAFVLATHDQEKTNIV